MARRKQTVIQRDMSLGEIRPDFLERADTDVRSISVKKSLNMRLLASGAAEARPGLKHLSDMNAAAQILDEWEPASGVQYALFARVGVLEVRDNVGAIVASIDTTTVFAGAGNDVVGSWVAVFGDQVILGNSKTLAELKYANDGTISFGSFEFASSGGGETIEPFWRYTDGITIQPSGRTGSITITSSAALFTTDFIEVGKSRIRYGGVQIQLTGRSSDTVATGDVVGSLPPTFRLSVGTGPDVNVGDVVVGQTTNFQGQVVAVGTSTIDVFTLDFHDGPDNGEKLSGPNTTLTSSSKTSLTPAATTIWDEQLISRYRGYPNAGSIAAGRLALTDFSQATSVIAISSARSIQDYEVGLRDDDAIVREVGDDRPRFVHVASVGDLVFLSDKGCYVQELRGGSILSPNTFNPVLFDRRGANSVRPVQVADGLVFVEKNGESVAAALLDGNLYLKWSVRTLTANHSQLINTPIGLAAPSLSNPTQENYLFIINSDGTLAVASFSQTLSEPAVGIVPWETNGEFRGIKSIYDTYWVIVDRTVDGGTERFLEAFDDGVYLDSALLPASAPSTNHLIGQTVKVIDGFADQGAYVVAADGSITDEPALPSDRQIGLDFEASMDPWAVQVIESVRHGVFDARCIRFLISVQDTVAINVKCNSHTRTLGGYKFGEDLGEQPPLRTERYAVPVFGRRQNAELSVSKAQPGPFRILYLGQEVQS